MRRAGATVVVMVVTAMMAHGQLYPRLEHPTLEDQAYQIGEVLYWDDFSGDLSNWQPEGDIMPVITDDGRMECKTKTGLTTWFAHKLSGNVIIEYERQAVVGRYGDSPLAVVNGVPIGQSEFHKRLMGNFGRDTLSDMIDRQLIRQVAEEEGITVSEEELNREVEEMKSKFPSEEHFIRWLRARDMSREEWREHLKLAMVVRKLAIKDVKYTDKELKAFFEQHKDRYALPVRVSLSEIVVASKEDAEEVLAEIKKGEATFGDLARVYSLARYSTARGGKRRQDTPLERVMPEPVRVAAKKLAVGEASDAIAAEGRWYIIQLDDRKLAREANWDKDRERVKRDYEAAHARPLRELVDEAINHASVQILDPRFQDLNEVYTPVPPESPGLGPQGAEVPGPTAGDSSVGGEYYCRDLNCFWMATDAEHPDDMWARSEWRGGDFKNYATLKLYYVGYGGGNNTTCRFRRYTGTSPPPDPIQHYDGNPHYLIVPSHAYKFQLVFYDGLVQYIRDGEVIFEYRDPDPYTEGYFGFRTVRNHEFIDNFKVYRLVPKE